MPSAMAFDGTDATPPKVVSIKQLTSAPSSTNELIAIEVVTQDDKNWVKITGTPQIGYSYSISNPSAAPNCSTVSNSFSKLEIIEDESFRKSDQSGQKSQRFLLVGYAPKPKELPISCPEYRNLSVLPVVALNTNTFLLSIDKKTKVKTSLNNLVTPTLQDEAGRVTMSTPLQSLESSNLILRTNNVGQTSQFCVSPSLIPKNNSAIATIQAKYIEQKASAMNLGIELQENPVIESYEAQVKIWMSLYSSFLIENVNKLGSCYIPFNSQQILTAYQDSIKSTQMSIGLIQKSQLLRDCEETNKANSNVLDFRNLINHEPTLFSQYKDFINQSKIIRILDCAKVTSKQLVDAQTNSKLILDFVSVNQNQGLQAFCMARNLKRTQFLDLTAKMVFRYQNTAEIGNWKNNPSNSTFQLCTPESQIQELISLADNANKNITQVNTLIVNLQVLERKKSINITIKCKSGKKSLIRTGKTPTCPTNYVEEKVEFKKIA